jgi:hypothetical protein
MDNGQVDGHGMLRAAMDGARLGVRASVSWPVILWEVLLAAGFFSLERVAGVFFFGQCTLRSLS